MLQLKQLENSRTERPINNQYMLITSRFIFFISYETFICAFDYESQNLLIFDYIKKLSVSKTTAKYLNQFLSEINFKLKNFRNDEKIEREKVMFRKLELASQDDMNFNVKYIPDSEVENLLKM